jgi:hypothetical protein
VAPTPLRRTSLAQIDSRSPPRARISSSGVGGAGCQPVGGGGWSGLWRWRPRTLDARRSASALTAASEAATVCCQRRATSSHQRCPPATGRPRSPRVRPAACSRHRPARWARSLHDVRDRPADQPEVDPLWPGEPDRLHRLGDQAQPPAERGEVGGQDHVVAAFQHPELVGQRLRSPAKIGLGDDVEDDLAGGGHVDQLWAQGPDPPADAEIQRAGAGDQPDIAGRGHPGAHGRIAHQPRIEPVINGLPGFDRGSAGVARTPLWPSVPAGPSGGRAGRVVTARPCAGRLEPNAYFVRTSKAECFAMTCSAVCSRSLRAAGLPLRTLQVANHRPRHTNPINQAQVQAQRGVGPGWPCTLDLIALADQPHSQRIPVGLALAGLGGRQRGQHHPGDHPDHKQGVPTSIKAATSATAP